MITFADHPILKPPTDEELAAMEPEELIELHRIYHEALANAQSDPYRYGFKPDNWNKAGELWGDYNELLVLGGNRSSKTRFGAWAVVKAAIENHGSVIYCFCQNAEASEKMQQPAVYEWLPSEYKAKQTSESAYISFSQKNGFTGGDFILPNGSRVIFKTYTQYLQNPTILEGAELGSRSPEWHNIGVWLDEYLVGPELIATLRFRLATRNAKMLVTFTPIDGWTEVIKDYLDGATTLERKPAELLGGELVPFIQKSKNRSAGIIYFHSQDNPFGGYERIKKDLAGRSREDILIRAYGVPVKSAATKFPKFSTDTNVIPHDKIPTENVSRFQIIDPSGSKNWFCVWIAVDITGTYYVYREWPGVNVGDWAEWRGGKWMPGEGAKGLGYGIRDYVDLFLSMEAGEKIEERIIDPRLGAAKYTANDHASSIIEDLADQDFVCIPAPGLEIDDGLQALISKMSYDTAKPLDAMNRPRFYISEHCENTIRALGEYTAEAGLKEAWKDPIDCLRYACVSNIEHFDGSARCTVQRTSKVGGY